MGGAITVEKSRKYPWWAYAALFCLCGANLLVLRFGEGTVIPPDTFLGRWYLFFLPILAAVVLTVVSRMRGRYDFVLLLAFELLLLVWFFVPNAIGRGGLYSPAELPFRYVIIILSLPAVSAFILSGIAYIFVKKK